MSINEEFVSVADFALLTGLTPAQIEGRYTVQVGNRKLVPRFMISGHSLPEVAHIELIPGNNGTGQHIPDLEIHPEYAAEAEYRPIATIELPTKALHNGALPHPAPAEKPQDNYIATLERDAFELDSALNAATQKIVSDKTSRRDSSTHRSSRVFSRSELGLMVHPFSRLVARTVDLTWETVALVFLVLTALQSLDSNLSSVFQTPLALAALGIMIAPFTLLLDAVIYSVFKNTPGKYLMGLKVVSKRLKTLKFSKYLKRNFRMWGRVLGFGILPLALFYMVREGFRIRRGLETNYDQAERTRVGKKLNSKSSALALAVVASALLLYALVLGGVLDPDALKSKLSNFLPSFLSGNSSLSNS